MKTVFVVGDIGATKELIPAGIKLRSKLAHYIFWIADPLGKGREVLKSERIPVNNISASQHAGEFDAILIGTSATAIKEQIEWTRCGQQAGTPVIWYEDLWGTGERLATRSVSPDLMITISETASTIAKRVRPGLQTQVVGKPSFETINDYNLDIIKQARQEIRDKLQIEESEFVILYWGGGDEGRVTHHLEMLMDIDKVNNQSISLLPRLHPKMPNRDYHWASYELSSNVIDAHQVEDLIALNCAADLVIGEFGSTQTYVAGLVGTYSLIAFTPDNSQQRCECGFIDGLPPQVISHIASSFSSQKDIMKHISRLQTSGNFREALYHKARKAFSDVIQLGAGRRIARAVLDFIKQ